MPRIPLRCISSQCRHKRPMKIRPEARTKISRRQLSFCKAGHTENCEFGAYKAMLTKQAHLYFLRHIVLLKKAALRTAIGANLVIYVVQRGDTLYSVSKKYALPVQAIQKENGLISDRLVPGQALVVLSGENTYTVRRGDSLHSISKKRGVLPEGLKQANPRLRPPYRLQPGAQLSLPEQRKKSILVNGYVFPQKNIDFNGIFPSISSLCIFSYHANTDGTLIAIEDTELILQARANRVAPIMTITNMNAGGFNSSLAHTLLTDTALQADYIRHILHTLDSKSYFGLNVDFEYVYPDDLEAYNRFISRMARILGKKRIPLTTALAPKIGAGQQGLLYTAHDYAHHGAQADRVILMTYEWGYTKGPAMAVAPLQKVREVLQYAVSLIPGEKILLGIPNYGYDWTLPFVRGTSARSLSNPEAVALASDAGVSIEYDETAQAPFFRYTDSSNRRHEVWFGDARSVQAILELVNLYGLGGVSYWTLARPFPQNWPVLRSMFNVKKLL